MITKKEAISILETYFEYEHNVDPLFNNWKKGVNRTSIKENEVGWILSYCQLEDINKTKFENGIGGGFYYVDKKYGKIYSGGSGNLGDWNNDFVAFMKGKKTKFEWKPKENTYLACKTSVFNPWKYEYHTKNCEVEKKEDFIQQNLLDVKEQLSNIIIRYKVIDGITCGISIGRPLKLENYSIETISIKIQNGFEGYNAAIWDCKKWLRVNGKKLTDNYWIEVVESDLTKEFIDWDLVFKMEYFNE